MKKFRIYAPKLINSSNQTIEEAIPIYGDIAEFIKYIEIEAEGIGDEYHSMNELYDHRRALTSVLFNEWAKVRKHLDLYFDVDKLITQNAISIPPVVMKSKLHNDGTMFEGYFIVMAITHLGQISYHYDLQYWEEFKIPEVERTPEYDGHTSEDVIYRLLGL